MKTKEEILKELTTGIFLFTGDTSSENLTIFRAKILEAMQLYSDQQNKELEEKLMSEQIENGYLQGFRVSNEAEIERLTKEVEELRKSVTPNPFLYPINSVKLKELVWKLDREVWAGVEAKEATTSWGREQTSLLISQYFGQSSNELTRLREEVEGLKKELAIERDDNEDLRRARDSFRTAINERNVELTRLRSLLERCKSVLDPSNRYYTNLLSEIEKPHRNRQRTKP